MFLIINLITLIVDYGYTFGEVINEYIYDYDTGLFLYAVRLLLIIPLIIGIKTLKKERKQDDLITTVSVKTKDCTVDYVLNKLSKFRSSLASFTSRIDLTLKEDNGDLVLDALNNLDKAERIYERIHLSLLNEKQVLTRMKRKKSNENILRAQYNMINNHLVLLSLKPKDLSDINEIDWMFNDGKFRPCNQVYNYYNKWLVSSPFRYIYGRKNYVGLSIIFASVFPNIPLIPMSAIAISTCTPWFIVIVTLVFAILFAIIFGYVGYGKTFEDREMNKRIEAAEKAFVTPNSNTSVVLFNKLYEYMYWNDFYKSIPINDYRKMQEEKKKQKK